MCVVCVCYNSNGYNFNGTTTFRQQHSPILELAVVNSWDHVDDAHHVHDVHEKEATDPIKVCACVSVRV